MKFQENIVNSFWNSNNLSWTIQSFKVYLCACLLVCWSIISKSSWPILMKLGRMMYNENISVPFKDEINWFGRTHTLAIWDVKIVLSYKVLEKHITSLGPLKLSIPFKNCTYIYYILLLHVTKVFFFLKKYSFFQSLKIGILIILNNL